MTNRWAAAFAVALSFFSLQSLADQPPGIVTGPKTGTYYAVGKDIAQTARRAGISMELKSSEGSIDNIKRLGGKENAVLGIVQSDVLGFLARSKNPDSMKMASKLRLIFPLYNEEVHVLARNEIKTFADLKGKKVAIGEEGSGNMLTAVNLFSMMRITPAQTKKIPSAQGVVAVLKGELDAVIFVGGKPVRLFKNLEDLTLPENAQYAPMLSEVHFLALDSPRMLEEYSPAEISRKDYTFVHDTVPTIAVQAVLIGYDSRGSKKRCDMLQTFAKALRADLPKLKEKGHPKWKEVKLDADTGVWKKDACIWPPETKAKDRLMDILAK